MFDLNFILSSSYIWSK